MSSGALAAPRGRLRLRTGYALLAVGLLVNPWTLQAVASRDGSIDSVASLQLIGLCQAVTLSLGLVFVLHRGRPARTAAVALWLLLLVLGAAEVALRLTGHGPWSMSPVRTRIEPGGRFFTEHPTRGFAHLPGVFTVRLASGYTFRVTHGPDTLRITSPPTADGSAGLSDRRPGIWTFGCSLTHGWTVEDHETWPWRLQAELPEHELVNFGVDAYGTLQSLIELREALDAGRPPDIVVLAYGSFHDERNSLPRVWRKTLARSVSLGPLNPPFARLSADGFEIVRSPRLYERFPLQTKLALSHLVERAWNDLESGRMQSHEVSRRIVAEFVRTVREAGGRPVIAGITSDPETADIAALCEALDAPFADIAVDLDLPENSNAPHDPHPSALANLRYAESLLGFLRQQGLVGGD